MSDLIGYVYGFKEIKSIEHNSVSIQFVTATSSAFPHKHVSKKDFWYEPVHAYDVCPIMINKDEFCRELSTSLGYNSADWVSQDIIKEYVDYFNKLGYGFCHDDIEFLYALQEVDLLSMARLNYEEIKTQVVPYYYLEKQPVYEEILKEKYEQELQNALKV